MDPVDLYRILLHGSVAHRARPAERRSIGPYTSEGNVRTLGHIDTKDVDEVWHRLPKRLP